jgi:hypothetical protein
MRMPVEKLICEENYGYKIKIINKKAFFIINTSTHRVLNFNSMDKFDSMLKKMSLGKSSEILNLSKFEEIIERYSRYYSNINFTDCKRM